jgi:chaperonin GroES
MQTELIACSNFVLIRLSEQDGRTPAGIILIRQEQKPSGEIIAMGPGMYQNGVLVPPTVKVGDRVIFSEFARMETVAQGIVAVREPEIVAVIR